MLIFIGTYLFRVVDSSKNIPKRVIPDLFTSLHFRVISIYLTALRQMHKQTSSRAMNTVVETASSASAYTYIRLYMYILLCYTFTLCIHKLKKLLCQDHKTNTLITQFAL